MLLQKLSDVPRKIRRVMLIIKNTVVALAGNEERGQREKSFSIPFYWSIAVINHEKMTAFSFKLFIFGVRCVVPYLASHLATTSAVLRILAQSYWRRRVDKSTLWMMFHMRVGLGIGHWASYQLVKMMMMVHKSFIIVVNNPLVLLPVIIIMV